MPSYTIDNLPERYNEALLKMTKLTMKENKNVMNALNLNYSKRSLSVRAYANQSIC